MEQQAAGQTVPGSVTIRPPFDPEIEPILAALESFPTLTSESLATFRKLVSGPPPGVDPIDFTVGGLCASKSVRCPDLRVPRISRW